MAPDAAKLLYLVDFVAEKGLALQRLPAVEAKQLSRNRFDDSIGAPSAPNQPAGP
jgi:hypothetical protein